MSTTETPDEHAAYDEDEAVFDWQVERFGDIKNAAGQRVFSASEATRLVLDGADWHQAAKLVKDGCPYAVMRRIL